MHIKSSTVIVILASLVLTGWSSCAYTQVQAKDAPETENLTWALGAGPMRSPVWIGAPRSREEAIPYIALEWRDRVEFNTTDGLYVDLLQASDWHGGLTGTWRRGRSARDLGKKLAGAGVSRLSNTLQAGLYLEHEPFRNLTLGIDVSRDIQSTRSAYGNLYVKWDIPILKPVEHSIRLSQEFMNRSAMRRYFSISGASAAALGLNAYRPASGASGTTVSYEAFLPTSRLTGFALGIHWTRLASEPANSPLVHDFGRRTQGTYFLAFVIHN